MAETKGGMFRFKQFTVDQSGCAMKINTDGVLLGAAARADDPLSILDIGTGTGVIALMLAQRYKEALIDAVETDLTAAETAAKNFRVSPFAGRMTLFAESFETYFDRFPCRKYDMIVSNPPFYTDSLKSPVSQKNVAKHADASFFPSLINAVSAHLTPKGTCWLVVPAAITNRIEEMTATKGLSPGERISVRSYPHSAPHRVILQLGYDDFVTPCNNEITIYEDKGAYSAAYQKLLCDFFLAF